MNDRNDAIRILALSRNQGHIFAPIAAVADNELLEIRETEEWTADEVVASQPDILVTATCSSFESVACIRAAQAMGIPTLLLVDGILEWRNEWENPRFGFGGKLLHDHPIITDKVACLGWRSLLTFEAWGNLGKCEIIGSPRFDGYIDNSNLVRETHNPRRVLVTTANTPGFTEQQRGLIEQSLRDLADILSHRPEWEVIWRVTRGLDTKLGLTDSYPHLKGLKLSTVLQEVDAVITTPSTVLLEAMLCGLPTALLDYTNSPQYVQAAWTATSREHLDSVIDGLYTPDQKRLVFQDEVLQLNLECRSIAMPRLLTLIREMVRIARNARQTSSGPNYPYQIIPTTVPLGTPSKNMRFQDLYPDHPVFARQDLTNLQLELIYLKQERDRLRKIAETRSIGYWISALGNATYRSYKRRAKKA